MTETITPQNYFYDMVADTDRFLDIPQTLSNNPKESEARANILSTQQKQRLLRLYQGFETFSVPEVAEHIPQRQFNEFLRTLKNRWDLPEDQDVNKVRHIFEAMLGIRINQHSVTTINNDNAWKEIIDGLFQELYEIQIPENKTTLTDIMQYLLLENPDNLIYLEELAEN